LEEELFALEGQLLKVQLEAELLENYLKQLEVEEEDLFLRVVEEDHLLKKAEVGEEEEVLLLKNENSSSMKVVEQVSFLKVDQILSCLESLQVELKGVVEEEEGLEQIDWELKCS